MLKLSIRLLFFIVLLSIFSELLLYIFIKSGYIHFNFGGGSDAEYYHEYALGYIEFSTSSWPILLRYLNELDLYSREGISCIFLFFHLFSIPYLTTKLSNIRFYGNQRIFFLIYLLCISYPTLYFYTLDIYRDIFMFLCFLIGCLTVKKTLNSPANISFIFFLIISIIIGLFLYSLRQYLGIAFLISLSFYKLKFNKKRLILLFSLYMISLAFAQNYGLLNALTEYRSGFDTIESGSTLGLDFSNPITFIPNFLLSTLGQLFGLYITSPLAIILLFIETLPFILMLKYVLKNISLADDFVRFLLIFFLVYASVWLIGNDNLGTAVRLRIYNYFAIYISFFYLLNMKRKMRIST